MANSVREKQGDESCKFGLEKGHVIMGKHQEGTTMSKQVVEASPTVVVSLSSLFYLMKYCSRCIFQSLFLWLAMSLVKFVK